MAFEATHVRFALDLADALHIRNVQAYLSGCVYPDSRYITGVSRELTHEPLTSIDDATDFEKGMLTHHWYDELVGPKYMERSPWPGPVKGMGEAWMYMTAAKLVEDQQSYDALRDGASVFQAAEPPIQGRYQERSEDLDFYYRILRDLYRYKPTFDEYAALFETFHIPTEVIKRVMEFVQKLIESIDTVREIRDFYEPALRVAKDHIRFKKREHTLHSC